VILYGLAHIGKTPAGLVAVLFIIVDPAVSILGCVPCESCEHVDKIGLAALSFLLTDLISVWYCARSDFLVSLLH